MQVKKQQLELDMEQETGSKLGREYVLHAEYIRLNAGMEESQAVTRLPGEISISSDMQMIPLWRQKAKN